MSEIKIPEIKLPTIDIPDAPYFTKPKLEGKLPGCYLYHRDLEITRNPSLLISDKRGTYTVCPNGEIPSYTPMRYDPAQIIDTEPVPVNTAPIQKDTNVTQPKPKKDNSWMKGKDGWEILDDENVEVARSEQTKPKGVPRRILRPLLVDLKAPESPRDTPKSSQKEPKRAPTRFQNNLRIEHDDFSKIDLPPERNQGF